MTILKLAASAERSSEHPLGKAIVSAAHKAKLETTLPHDFKMLPGHGIRASVDGLEVAIGARMLQEMGIIVNNAKKKKISLLESRGNTVIPVAIGGEVSGLMVISDSVRPESREAISDLMDMNIRETVLISGDNVQVAEAVGVELGVTKIYAETLPKQKLDFIRELQFDGLKVAYVGDGINDAPALAAADVGIAMGDIGTNVAMETADIVLLTDNIDRLPYLIDLSRDSSAVIRNNVIFSMGINILSVLLSIFGVIGPVVGAVMHEVSALPVVANSARIIGRRARFLAE
jgi:Cd2+/Zn2+-exporting ATPase